MTHSPNEVQRIRNLLRKNGFVTHEEASLGSPAFEFPDELKKDLRAIGVQGTILSGVHNRQGGNGSTFYWLFLESDRDKAVKTAETWAINHPDPYLGE